MCEKCEQMNHQIALKKHLNAHHNNSTEKGLVTGAESNCDLCGDIIPEGQERLKFKPQNDNSLSNIEICTICLKKFSGMIDEELFQQLNSKRVAEEM